MRNWQPSGRCWRVYGQNAHDQGICDQGADKQEAYSQDIYRQNVYKQKVYSQGVYRQKEHKQKAAMQEICDQEEALARVLSLIGDTEVTIDHFATPRPLSLARLLLESGFHVTRVYLDVVAQEEKDDFDWLRDRFPDLILNATVHPGMRVLHKRENEGHMLAIGPKAAWFGGTAHFVNLVECGGLWGFTGIEKLAAQMEDAFLHEKDTRKLVPRKGFGCTCVL